MPSNPHEDEVWQRPKKNRPRDIQKSFDLRSLLPVHRKKTALPIPVVIPYEPVVFFIWPDAVADDHLAALQDICEQVTYLGRSRSLVRASVVSDPPAATHRPDVLGQVQLRVPGPKRLDDLVDKHRRDGGKPEPCPPRRYGRMVDVELEPETQSTVFDRMYVLQPRREAPALSVESTVNLTKAVRKAILACVHAAVCGCTRWEQGAPRPDEALACYAKIPPLISGHERDGSLAQRPHIAFAALPFVHPRVRHADGGIKGLAILVPRCNDHDVLLPLTSALEHLQANGLSIPGVGIWHLAEVPGDDPPLETLDVRTWRRPARVWTTVTPMAFGHFPKPQNGGEPQVVLDSLQMIGVDPQSVIEIAVGRHSPLHGVPPSWCFKTRHNGTEERAPRRLIRHVTLRFDRPVRGPIVLGCQRYFGLGLMRPLEEEG